MPTKILITLILLIPLITFSQVSQESMYDFKNYREVKRGSIDGYDNVILYVHKNDTNYTCQEVHYMDSTYRDSSFMKTFFFKNIENGPYISFIEGKVSQKGNYKNGYKDGEKLWFEQGKLVSRSFYANGIKTGKWEEYDSEGKLIEIRTYDKEGNFVKSEKF